MESISLTKASIKSISWLHQINYGGVEERAYNVAIFLSRFADVEFLFARTILSNSGFLRYFPTILKHKTHKIATFLSRFALESLFERKALSDPHYHSKVNFRFKPIQIYFNPYEFYRKRFWEEFFIKKATRNLKRDKKNIDLVEGQGINAVPGIKLKLPTVTTIHGVDRWIDNPPILEKVILKKSNKIVVTTRRVQSQLIKKGVEEKKISVIYNGVDFHKINNTKVESRDFLTRYGLDPHRKVILSVHNFSKVKNTRSIIDSFVGIKGKFDEYQLVFVGDGPERQYYKNYVKRKRIRDVHFIGKRFKEVLYQFYKSAEIFVLPSLRESWGIVFLEAMAAKCAVVLSTNCGITEIVKDKKNGLIVSPYSQSAIENALKTLIEDNNLRKRLEKNGYELARTFSWEKQGKLFWDEIQELIK